MISLQSDKEMLSVLDFLFDICRGHQKQPVDRPWCVRTDVDDIESDEGHKKKEGEMSAPFLFLYYDCTSEFQGAVICADECKIVLRSCFSNVVLAYVGVYHVCQIGYNKHWLNFLQLLEHIAFNIPFSKGKYMPIKLERFLTDKPWKKSP